MEEVLVWVMGNAGGTRILIGSWGNHGVIYRCDWADESGEIDRGTYRSQLERQAELNVIGITQRAESRYDIILEPTVLRVPPPPYGSYANLNDWVETDVWPVVEARMSDESAGPCRVVPTADHRVSMATRSLI